MKEVTVRELCSHTSEVLDRVARGEVLTITRDGRPVAQLSPLRRGAVPSHVIVARWRVLQPVDSDALRADLDRVLDASL